MDPWDDQSDGAGFSGSAQPTWGNQYTAIRKPKPVAAIVKDDWEDEEEEEDSDVVERNKKIWADAELKEARPMPALLISRGSSSITAPPSLPLNQPPPMRILKRPSPANSNPPSPSPGLTGAGNTTETLKEREVRYQAARERIFGTNQSEDAPAISPSEKSSDEKNAERRSPPGNRVIREPRGPNMNGRTEKGFADRQWPGSGQRSPSKNVASDSL